MSETTIGPYRLTRRIGSGNMGEVHLAMRSDGMFEKNVAIKLIRADRLDDAARSRFVSEQKILAKLEHPSISRLIDAGIDKLKGSPYIVMEFVDGVDIATYCKSKNLTVEEIIHLFIKVCDAVSFAHRNFIIHRDLKPSNILVDTQGDVKVLDFGIAKMIDSGDGTEINPTLANPFTPRYASPEQLTAKNLTTGSDIYSLGVLLYELLTGSRIFPDAKSDMELANYIIAETPKNPSEMVTHIDQLEETQVPGSPASASKNLELRKHRVRRKLIEGDLDKVTLKALRKEAERRYLSVDEFREDLERFLGGKPVTAQGDSLVYVGKKLILRNKFTSMVCAFAFLLAVLQISLIYRDFKNTEEQLRSSQETSKFFQSIFEPVSLEVRKGKPILAKDLIKLKANELDTIFPQQPKLRAQIMLSMAQVQFDFAEYDSAINIIESLLTNKTNKSIDGSKIEALVIRAKAEKELGLPKDSINTLIQAQNSLVKIPSGISTCKSCLEIDILTVRGEVEQIQSKYEDSLKSFSKAEQIHRSTNPDDKRVTYDIFLGLAEYYRFKGEYKKSLDLLEALKGILDRDLDDHELKLSKVKMSIADNYIQQERFKEAIKIYTEVEAIVETILGGESPELGIIYNEQALIYIHLQDIDKAVQLLGRAITLELKLFGEEYIGLATRYNNMAAILNRQGRHKKAIEYLNKGINIELRYRDPFDINIGIKYLNLGDTHHRLGNFKQAIEYFRKGLEIDRKAYGESSKEVAGNYILIGRTLSQMGRYQESREYLEKALSINSGLSHPSKSIKERAERELSKIQTKK
ncbi:MAG: serine/threonine protein kinase [Pseudobacteriovorax sp.]|nr:serine/threonine protein kinase [Pseudobacteriovorax sp.]